MCRGDGVGRMDCGGGKDKQIFRNQSSISCLSKVIKGNGDRLEKYISCCLFIKHIKVQNFLMRIFHFNDWMHFNEKI